MPFALLKVADSQPVKFVATESSEILSLAAERQSRHTKHSASGGPFQW
jgi:hypothetical protein